MCGIAGFVTKDGGGIPEEALRRAIRLLEHRGPDDLGFLSRRGETFYLGREPARQVPGANILLVHRRLSILDLSDAGWQPMCSPDGRYCIVYNGELYNYIELRDELKELGHRFRGNSDTEVLLAAFVEWGEAALQRFVGMFAFAILDVVEQSLFLARDFFGIKPLFYTSGDSQFGFASEIKVLLSCLKVPRTANPERIYHYLRYGATDYGSDTMFQQVRQLPPAHWMRIDLRSMSVAEPHCYWSLPTERSIDVSFDEAVDAVREQFLDNIRLHLRSDVPIGAALSGGIDSSAIVAAMRTVGGADLDLRTFSYIPDDERLSEERWVDEVGRVSGAEMHKVRPNAGTLADDVLHLTRLHDEPLGGMSAVAQHHVFRRAQEMGIKVMLDGQGADEVLGGYRLFLGARMATLLRNGRFAQAASFLSRCARLPDCGFPGMAMLTMECMLPESLQTPLRKLVGRDLEPPWLNHEWFREFAVVPHVRTYTKQRDVLHRQLCRAIATGLPRLLRFEDRNSMSHSIESRVPFLTPSFVTYLSSLPEEYIISPNGVTKSVFREAMRGIVPNCVLDRRDKLGYPTPGAKWLSAVHQWVERTLSGDLASRIPALRLKQVRREWDLMSSGKKPFSLCVWRCVNLITWTTTFEVEYE